MPAQKKTDVILEEGAVYVLRSGTSVFVKTADICAMTGKSNQWIGQLISQGTLNKRNTPHGSLFDVTSAVRAYCDMLEARARSDDDKEREAAENERLTADVMLKKARAIRANLEAKELMGKMHRSEDVADMTEDLIYTIRSMLLALPGRLAVDAAAATDPSEVSEVVRREVYSIMEELSRYKYNAHKYEERVRKRQNWDKSDGEDSYDEDS